MHFKKWPLYTLHFNQIMIEVMGAAVAEWLSSWLAEQEVRGSIEIGYRLLPNRDMTETPLKRRKSSIQPTHRDWSD